MSNQYLYCQITHLFQGNYNNELYHPFSTNVEPPPPDSRFNIKWFPSSNEWFYVEKQNDDSLKKIMDYTELRKMYYPPMTDYLDGIVKGDMEQIANYTSNCLLVKERFPKTMESITLKQHYIDIGLLLTNSNADF